MPNKSFILPANPHANYLSHKAEIDTSVERVFESGSYILGQEVTLFEKEFARFTGTCFAIGVANGTEAIQLALIACGIKPKDEVITVSHTAVATISAIELCEAVPVLIDIDPVTYTINPDQIEKAVTKRTKAIIPVHLYGHPADMSSINLIATRCGLRVIEDCAQSHGASINGKMTGSFGDMGTFSFYPTKNLGALGDGGIIITDDRKLAEKVKSLREYGWQKRYVSVTPGMNSRLDEVQAAILRVKLRYLEEENTLRLEIASIYNQLLAGTLFELPTLRPGVTHVYHQYVVRTKNRDKLRTFLETAGIKTLIHYPMAVHQQPAYKGRLRCPYRLVETEKAVKEILSLPMYPELPHEKARYIAKKLCEWDSDPPKYQSSSITRLDKCDM